MTARTSWTGVLPDFPWDLLAPHGRRAAEHPGGLVDLSIGTPVDPSPAVVRAALAAASDAPGYPKTAGTPALRAALALPCWGWLARRRYRIAPWWGALCPIGLAIYFCLAAHTLLRLRSGRGIIWKGRTFS